MQESALPTLSPHRRASPSTRSGARAGSSTRSRSRVAPAGKVHAQRRLPHGQLSVYERFCDKLNDGLDVLADCVEAAIPPTKRLFVTLWRIVVAVVRFVGSHLYALGIQRSILYACVIALTVYTIMLMRLWGGMSSDTLGLPTAFVPRTLRPPRGAQTIWDSKMSLSKVYRRAALDRGAEYTHYEAKVVTLGDHHLLEDITDLGHGGHSSTFFARRKDPVTLEYEDVVIKVLDDVKRTYVKREIHMMEILCGGPFLMKLIDVVKCPEEVQDWDDVVNPLMPCFVTERLGMNVSTLYVGKSGLEVMPQLQFKKVMYQVLKALAYMHEQGIMHRDVKPTNIVFDTETDRAALIDFGLAEFYVPGRQYSSSVMTDHYKAPELLVPVKDYDYSMDMWGFGTLLYSFTHKKRDLWHERENYAVLGRIARVLGTDAMWDYAYKYGAADDLDFKYHDKKFNEALYGYEGASPPNYGSAAVAALSPTSTSRPWFEAAKGHAYAPANTKERWAVGPTPAGDNVTVDTAEYGVALDLLDKLFVWDHAERLTAQEALQHAYWDEVRDQYDADPRSQYDATGCAGTVMVDPGDPILVAAGHTGG